MTEPGPYSGWWLASDGRWYPPEPEAQLPTAQQPTAQQPTARQPTARQPTLPPFQPWVSSPAVPAGPRVSSWAPYPQPYASGGGMLVSNRSDKGVQAVFAWIFTVLTLGYFLPWAIAATRGKSNAGAVGLLNFLLGWTFIGWIVALVMACGSHQFVVAGSPTIVQQHIAVQLQPPYAQPSQYQPVQYPYDRTQPMQTHVPPPWEGQPPG